MHANTHKHPPTHTHNYTWAVAIQQQQQRTPPLDSTAAAAHRLTFKAGGLPLTLPHTELLVAEVLVGVLMGLELLTLGFGCLLQTAYSQVCVWVCVCVCESARVSVCVACEVFVCMYMCV